VERDEHRERRAGSVPGFVAAVPLEDAPAIVAASPRAPGREVDLFPLILSGIADYEGSGQSIEREAHGFRKP
jgi:hypothetical protein